MKNDAKDKKEVCPIIPSCLGTALLLTALYYLDSTSHSYNKMLTFAAFFCLRLRIMRGEKRTWKKPRRSSLRMTPACLILKLSVFFTLQLFSLLPCHQLRCFFAKSLFYQHLINCKYDFLCVCCNNLWLGVMYLLFCYKSLSHVSNPKKYILTVS